MGNFHSGLAVYCYTLPSSSPVVSVVQPEQLTITTNAPGGFGSATFRVRLPDARLPRPELTIFARVGVEGHGANGANRGVFVGEISDPQLALDSSGEYVQVSALGIGNALRDDQMSIAYSNQTAQAIVIDQLTGHNRPNFLPLDQDTSAIFPDNPTATFAPVYDGSTIEEIVQNMAVLSGDYTWGVWAHAVNKDAAGFPTGQLVVQKRDTTTTHYTANLSQGDLIGYQITPTSQRAYNVIQIGYNAGVSGYGTATYTDPRLGAGGAQGSAPFRRRQFRRDLSGTTSIGASQAQALANTYGAQFNNATVAVQLTLKSVRDPNGNVIPPWEVQAGKNIYIPELAVRSIGQLPQGAVPGINQFYIVQSTYSEDANGWTLTLQCDNYVDSANLQLTMLQLQADVQRRGGKVNGIFQLQGAAESGYASCTSGGASLAGGATCISSVNFKTYMAQQPTTILLANASSGLVNVSLIAASQINCVGFQLTATANGAGQVVWLGTYTTVGNTLHRVEHGSDTFDWHCSGCDTLHTGLPVAGLGVLRHAHRPDVPEHNGLAVTCPSCGLVESFNCGLTAADEDAETPGNYPHRAQHARLIRALQRHPQIALPTR